MPYVYTWHLYVYMSIVFQLFLVCFGSGGTEDSLAILRLAKLLVADMFLSHCSLLRWDLVMGHGSVSPGEGVYSLRAPALMSESQDFQAEEG
jgi:hypothetical protein